MPKRGGITELNFGNHESINGTSITREGEEVGQHYGWVFEGIARTQADLDDHATQPGAQVGDCLYKDINEKVGGVRFVLPRMPLCKCYPLQRHGL